MKNNFSKIIRTIISIRSLFIGIILSLIVIIITIFGPIIYNVDPINLDSKNILLPPFTSISHILGTDHLGRDIFSRLIHGGKITLFIAWSSALGGAIVGTVFGIMSGYYGKFVDNVIMRLIESIMTFPFIIIALLLASLFVPGVTTLIIVFIIVGAPVFAKVIRGVAISIKNEEYILAARSLGSNDFRIMFFHFLPNIFPQILIITTLQISRIIFAEAGLSFIGVGVQPPYPSWGSMLADGRTYMAVSWWLPFLPGLALVVTILGANFLGDGLQELLDPKRKSKIIN